MGKKSSMNTGNISKLMMMAAMCSANVLAEDTAFTEETAAAYLKLTPPVKILLYGGYLDGGSIGTSLVDAEEKEFHMFEDWSIGSGGEFTKRTDLPDFMREQFKDRPVTKGRIFIGEGSPTKDRKITPEEEGKRIKAAVECLAIAWFDREFTPEEQAVFMEYFQKRGRGEKPSDWDLMVKFVPQKPETEEEKEDFLNKRLERRGRFESAKYIAGKLKGWNPPRKKAETPEPTP